MLGLGGSSHEFSAALMYGDDIKVAIESERISRVKHGRALWFQNPLAGAVDYCLRAEDITLADVSRIVSSDLLPYKVRDIYSGHRLTLYPHHISHAASVHMMLDPGVRAAVFVYDGMGSVTSSRQDPGSPVPRVKRETFSFFQAQDDQLTYLGGTHGEGLLEHVEYGNGVTNSIGLLYELVTVVLGFEPDDVGKTMGLAGHGQPTALPLLKKYVTLGSTFEDIFQVDFFSGDLEGALREFVERGGGGFQAKADLAASVQELLNETLVRCSELYDPNDYDVFAVAGGCGLNTVANGVLAERLPAGKSLLVAPHATDVGHAFGALWLDRQEHGEGSLALTLNGAPLNPAIGRPGRRYSEIEITTAVNAVYPRLALDPMISSPEGLAARLAGGSAIGVFNGSSEIGPRALGGRSILADPRTVEMKERINRHIKLREPFRPLAPMVLAEDFSDWFHPEATRDHFMLKIAHGTERCLREAPAVVHVDGGARVQVVDDNTDPFLVRLLREFKRLTGVPVLLNTSFNRRGEPVVETPADAIDAFFSLGLDGLYLDGRFFLAQQTED
ncbi:carbamoyltransferase C-terminal domain-containing protein [Kribbella sp. NPDC051620]|uniref:carbamoyltransferase C-terminal domain-containing protein n=1 Tax=Kribbella sp. NPDC051620 TaxID=3364120 RepID=UPI00379B7BBD